LSELENTLIKNNEYLMKQLAQANRVNEANAEEIRLLREQINYLTRKLFGRSSEKSIPEIDGQQSLFDDKENTSFMTSETTEYETVHYPNRRKKRKGYKAELTKDLPVEEIHCELPEEQRKCTCCHSELHHIGKDFVREEVIFVPATMYKKVYYQHSYVCPSCDIYGDQQIEKASVPKPVIGKSLASPSVLAHLFHQKFEMSLPYYRQEAEWVEYGLKVPRRTLANWVIIASEKWLDPMFALLREKLLNQEFLHADETPYRVLSCDHEKSYFWLFRTIKNATNQIALFQFDLSRKGQIARDFLHGFHGYLHCDAYAAYGTLEGITIVNCWAHLRRKFFEAIGKDDNPKSKASIGYNFCNQLFKIERDISEMSPNERLEVREEKSKPILNKFWSWLESFYALPKSKLGKAVTYAFNHRQGFMNFLLDGHCAISNNIAERSIRPITIGRKNWNFSTSIRGAKANGVAYSIIETAKANGLNPSKYFEYLFTHLPNLVDISKKSTLEAYLPWTEEVQMNCR
jgi:transposase